MEGTEGTTGAGERAGEHGSRLVLAAAVDGIKDGGLEVVREACGEIVSGWKLVVDRAWHAEPQPNQRGEE